MRCLATRATTSLTLQTIVETMTSVVVPTPTPASLMLETR